MLDIHMFLMKILECTIVILIPVVVKLGSITQGMMNFNDVVKRCCSNVRCQLKSSNNEVFIHNDDIQHSHSGEHIIAE